MPYVACKARLVPDVQVTITVGRHFENNAWRLSAGEHVPNPSSLSVLVLHGFSPYTSLDQCTSEVLYGGSVARPVARHYHNPLHARRGKA